MTTETTAPVTAPSATTSAPSTGATITAPIATAAPATTAAPAPSWTDGFSDDLKGFVGAKGWKDPASVADSYRNLEKLTGVPPERMMKLPDSFYDDKGKLTADGRAIYERLGAPKEAKDYNLTVPKEGGDPALMEHFKNVFHEAGIPKAAAEKIVGSWNEYNGKLSEAAKAQHAQAFKDQETALKTEWGMAVEQNTNIAKEAVRAMGVNAQQIDAISAALGHAETMKLFHKFGQQVGEAPFVGGNRTNTVLEPVTAQSKIQELRGDREFGQRLMNGDVDAKRTWENLHKQAFPGQVNI